jgi:two-component system, chemotaxis family, chemotaxis protein CheY
MNILVVDDSRAVHAFIENVFAGSRHALTHVYNGKEAFELIRQGQDRFDLVLLDWEMPVMNGLEALQAIRSCSAGLPIIMVTTKNDPESITEALVKGATEFVMKPFTKDILFSKMGQVLGTEVA